MARLRLKFVVELYSCMVIKMEYLILGNIDEETLHRSINYELRPERYDLYGVGKSWRWKG